MDTRSEKFSSKMTASERAAQRKRIREREEAERKKRKEAKHKAALEKQAQGESKGSADSSKNSDSQSPDPIKNDSSKGGELSGASPVVPPNPPALTPAVVLDQNAKTVCAQLPTITDVQLLKDALSAEEADKKRATVLNALRDRIQQLEGQG